MDNTATIREVRPRLAEGVSTAAATEHPVEGYAAFRPAHVAVAARATVQAAALHPMPAVLLMSGWEAMVGWAPRAATPDIKPVAAAPSPRVAAPPVEAPPPRRVEPPPPPAIVVPPPRATVVPPAPVVQPPAAFSAPPVHVVAPPAAFTAPPVRVAPPSPSFVERPAPVRSMPAPEPAAAKPVPAWQPSYAKVSVPSDSVPAVPVVSSIVHDGPPTHPSPAPAPPPPNTWVSTFPGPAAAPKPAPVAVTPPAPVPAPRPVPVVAAPAPASASSWNPYKTAAHRQDVMGAPIGPTTPEPPVLELDALLLEPVPVVPGGYPGDNPSARPAFNAEAGRLVVAKIDPKKRHNLVRLTGATPMAEAVKDGLGLDESEMRELLRWAWEQKILTF